MAEQFTELNEDHRRMISAQHMFFVATAAEHGHVNLSPKGGDSLRVVDATHLVWVNLTGSGNESAAHVLRTNRMTLMWCAFEGPPVILRVYGRATTVHPRHPRWPELAGILPPPAGARQYFLVDISLVLTSCGYAVPNYTFEGQRTVLEKWTRKHGPEGIQAYWEEHNQTSLNGFPSGILED